MTTQPPDPNEPDPARDPDLANASGSGPLINAIGVILVAIVLWAWLGEWVRHVVAWVMIWALDSR